MARIRREETAFPSSPDPRFGGNMARATEGAQYRGSPRDYYGGPSKGSPMHDARYGNYVAPHRVDYTSPRQTRPQGGTYSHKLGHTGGYEFNPRPNIKGHFQKPMPIRFPKSGPAGAPVEGPWNREYDTPMMGGIVGLQEQAGLWQDIKRILKRTKNPDPLIDQWTDHWMKSQRMAGNDTGIGSTNEYQTARLNEYPDYYYNYIPGRYGGDADDVIEIDIGGGTGPSELPDLADWLQGQGVRT